MKTISKRSVNVMRTVNNLIRKVAVGRRPQHSLYFQMQHFFERSDIFFVTKIMCFLKIILQIFLFVYTVWSVQFHSLSQWHILIFLVFIFLFASLSGVLSAYLTNCDISDRGIQCNYFGSRFLLRRKSGCIRTQTTHKVIVYTCISKTIHTHEIYIFALSLSFSYTPEIYSHDKHTHEIYSHTQ